MSVKQFEDCGTYRGQLMAHHAHWPIGMTTSIPVHPQYGHVILATLPTRPWELELAVFSQTSCPKTETCHHLASVEPQPQSSHAGSAQGGRRRVHVLAINVKRRGQLVPVLLGEA